MGRTWGKTVKLSGPGMQPRFMKARKRAAKKRPNAPIVRRVRDEIKRFDLSPAGAVVTSAGTLIRVGAMAQGVTHSERIGNRIYAKYIRFSAVIVNNAAVQSGAVRFIMFIDTEGTTANPATIASLLDTVVAGNGITSAINSDHTQRYTILMDKVVTVSAGGPTQLQFKKFRRLKLVSYFVGGLSTDLDKNTVYIAMLSGEAVNGPTVIYHSRFAFNDP